MLSRGISRMFPSMLAALALGSSLAQAQATHQPVSDTIDVRPKAKAEVSPDTLEGSYKQPQWSAHRLFTNSRVYVIEEHQVEVEAWAKIQTFTDTNQNYVRYQQEIEVGLGHHLQLDVYVNEHNFYNPDKGKRMYDMEGQQYELRWALADWGALPMNPTLYFEYHPIKNNPERFEFRLLLSDNIAANWHYAANLGYEVDLWGSKDEGRPEREIPLDFAIGTTTFNPHLSVGAEVKVEWRDDANTRGHFVQEVDVGPALQWRPTHDFHLNVSPLWGVKDVDKNISPVMETWIIAGLEL